MEEIDISEKRVEKTGHKRTSQEGVSGWFGMTKIHVPTRKRFIAMFYMCIAS